MGVVLCCNWHILCFPVESVPHRLWAALLFPTIFHSRRDIFVISDILKKLPLGMHGSNGPWIGCQQTSNLSHLASVCFFSFHPFQFYECSNFSCLLLIRIEEVPICLHQDVVLHIHYDHLSSYVIPCRILRSSGLNLYGLFPVIWGSIPFSKRPSRYYNTFRWYTTSFRRHWVRW